MTVKRVAAAVNESSPDQRNTVGAGSFAEKVMSDHDRGFYGKWKAFGEIEADQESTGSSEDMESPRSVMAAKVRKWPAINKNANLYVHSQVLRIREEDSLIGEDVAAENLNTAKSDDDCHRYRNVDVLILSHRPVLPASPLSGKAIKSTTKLN